MDCSTPSSPFTRDLRAAGVDARAPRRSTASAPLAHVGIGERPLVRAALQATLVKRAEDLDVFELLFDRHFPPTRGRSAGHRPPAVATPSEGDAIRLGRRRRFGPAGGVPHALVDAVRLGDDDALVLLAEEAVARYSGIETQPGSERYFLYRVMRALDLSNLLIAVMAQATHRASGQLGVRAASAPRRRAAAHRSAAPPARRRRSAAGSPPAMPTSCRTMPLPRRVEDIDVLGASTAELHEAARCRSPARPQAGQPGRPATSPPSPRQPRRSPHDASIA